MSAQAMLSPLDEHLHAVREMLAQVYRREGRNQEGVDNHTPLDALLEKEEQDSAGEEMLIGQEKLRRMMGWIFEAGPDPAAAMQRLYALARCCFPELILNMTGEEVAVIFGQGRAAESARIGLLNAKLKAAGFRNHLFRFQKSAGSRPKYAAAQRGNQNRRNGKRRSQRAEAGQQRTEDRRQRTAQRGEAAAQAA